jgi:hypothetical protein
MADRQGARQQKRVAKQKAKRQAKRAALQRRSSKDPTVRLQNAEKWPVVRALAGAELWDDGIGYLVLARQESEGWLVFASFLVDVYCLGVKNAFWTAGSSQELAELLRRMDATQTMQPIDPACLVKIVTGAVTFAHSFGFSPHRDYRHAALLFEGIDPSECPDQFTYGRDGKPFYIQGPNESSAQAESIMRRAVEAGGHYVIGESLGRVESLDTEDAFGELEDLDEEDSADE